MTPPLARADIEVAIATYAPVLQLHPDEKYLNCSVEYYLSQATLVDSKDPKKTIVHPLQSQLPQGPKDGTRYSLHLDSSVKAGDFTTAKAYVNALWIKTTTYTDLQFWFFSAYNGHGTARFDSLLLNKVKHQGDVDLTPLYVLRKRVPLLLHTVSYFFCLSRYSTLSSETF
jgi:Vacuolar protein sorting-associated protein 62